MALKFLLTFLSTDIISAVVVYAGDEKNTEFASNIFSVSVWLTYISSIFYIWNL